MAVTEITLNRWAKLNHPHRADKQASPGLSPGGVAAALGITRQAVHQAIARGDLDAYRIIGEDGGLRAILVTPESVDRYTALRELRNAG